MAAGQTINQAYSERAALRAAFREDLWQKIQDMVVGERLTLGEAIQELERINQRLGRLWKQEQSG